MFRVIIQKHISMVYHSGKSGMQNNILFTIRSTRKVTLMA